MTRTTLLIALCLFSAGFLVAPADAGDLNEGIALFKQSEFEDALRFFHGEVRRNSKNVDALAWLAETQRRVGKIKVATATAWDAVDLDPCHAFAHQVLSDIYRQRGGSDSDLDAWEHILEAVDCDPEDGNVWTSAWPLAIQFGDDELRRRAIQRLGELEFFGAGAYAYNRWVLQSVPENGILIVEGDMSTYPALILQETQDYRPDVAIVSYPMLNTRWYRKAVARQYDLPMMSGEFKTRVDEHGNAISAADQVLDWWLRRKGVGLLLRPLAIDAGSISFAFGERGEEPFALVGPVHLYVEDPPEDPEEQTGFDETAIRESLERVDAAEIAQPFTSDQDRSPIRARSESLRNSIPTTAIRLAFALVNEDRVEEGVELIGWGREFSAAAPAEPSLEGAFIGFDISLSRYYMNLEKYTEAEPLLVSALDWFEENQDESNIGGLVSALDALAHLNTELGRYEEARDNYERSLEVRVENFGPDHPVVADGYDNMGIALQQLGENEEAIEYHRKALAILQSFLDPSHPRIAQCQNNLGYSLVLFGEYDEAEPMLRESLASTREAREPGDPSLAYVLDSLGELLVRKGEPAEAEPIIAEALEIREATSPAGSFWIAYEQSLMARCLTDLERYAEAEALLLEALPVMKESRGIEDKDVQITVERVITLYEAWGKTDQAEKYRPELLK